MGAGLIDDFIRSILSVLICSYHFVHAILSNTILSVYHFVRTILSVPFCPLPFCPIEPSLFLLDVAGHLRTRRGPDAARGPVWYENPSGVVIRPDNTKHKHRWSGQCCDWFS